MLFSDDTLTHAQAAELLKITTRTLDMWTRRGLRGVILRPSYVGGLRYYTRPQLKEFQTRVDERRAATLRTISREERTLRQREARQARAGLERIYGRGRVPGVQQTEASEG
jgi:DNA-binding transcriptional MerR regulator